MGSRAHNRSSFARRAVIGAVALAVLASWVPAAGASSPASTKAQLQAARAKLAGLEQRITSEQAAVAASQTKLLSLAAQLHAARTRFDAIQQQLTVTRSSLAATQAEYDAIRARLDARAVTAFMLGPANGIEFVLESTSAANLAARVQFLDSLAAEDGSLSQQVQAAATKLAATKARQSALLSTQASLVTTLSDEETALAATFATQQRDLSDLATARTQLATTVTKLEKQLQAQQLAAALAALGGSSSVSYGSWAGTLLRSLGDGVCRNDLIVVIAWETAERTAASWNPLATTYPMPGATQFNSVGVRNYRSMGQGIQATILTLHTASHGYGEILSGLSGCADPMTTARAINASSWCRGCAGGNYVVDFIPIVEGYFHR